MSLENQKPNAEDMKMANNPFNDGLENDYEIIVGSLDHISEVIDHREAWTVPTLNKRFTEKITTLNGDFLKIISYIQAKEQYSKIADSLSELIPQTQTEASTLPEKISLLQRYEQVIKTFEEEHVAADVLAQAKSTAVQLRDTITTLTAIQKVGTDNPDYN